MESSAQYPDEGKDSAQWQNKVDEVFVEVYYGRPYTTIVAPIGEEPVPEPDTLFSEEHYTLILKDGQHSYFQDYLRNGRVEFFSKPIFSNDTVFSRKRFADGEFDYEEYIIDKTTDLDSMVSVYQIYADLGREGYKTYDEQGRLIKWVVRDLFSPGYFSGDQIIEPSTTYKFEYNEAGELITKRSYDTFQAPVSRWEYTYNEKGLVSTINYFGEQGIRSYRVFKYSYNLNL